LPSLIGLCYQTLYSVDGPLPTLCLAVALSHQDGRYSAVALLLKAALIQVSDYRLLGASGFKLKYLVIELRVVRNGMDVKEHERVSNVTLKT